MKSSVYVETTVISYLTAWPSRDLVRAAQQQITHEWWNTQRHRFDLFASELVALEASAGDPEAAADRMAVVGTLAMVGISENVNLLGEALLANAALPRAASRDASPPPRCMG